MLLTNVAVAGIMKLPRVIALCGRRRAGKDTIASILYELHGYENVKISQDLKDAAKILFGFTNDQIESGLKDQIDERWGISPRQALQFIGTEVMQYSINDLLPSIGRKFWIKGCIQKHIAPCEEKLVVLSDLRFVHEYEELKNTFLGDFMVIRIERERHDVNALLDEHVSEKEYLNIPFDAMITNNGTKAELLTKVKNMFAAD